MAAGPSSTPTLFPSEVGESRRTSPVEEALAAARAATQREAGRRREEVARMASSPPPSSVPSFAAFASPRSRSEGPAAVARAFSVDSPPVVFSPREVEEKIAEMKKVRAEIAAALAGPSEPTAAAEESAPVPSPAMEEAGVPEAAPPAEETLPVLLSGKATEQAPLPPLPAHIAAQAVPEPTLRYTRRRLKFGASASASPHKGKVEGVRTGTPSPTRDEPASSEASSSEKVDYNYSSDEEALAEDVELAQSGATEAPLPDAPVERPGGTDIGLGKLAALLEATQGEVATGTVPATEEDLEEGEITPESQIVPYTEEGEDTSEGRSGSRRKVIAKRRGKMIPEAATEEPKTLSAEEVAQIVTFLRSDTGLKLLVPLPPLRKPMTTEESRQLEDRLAEYVVRSEEETPTGETAQPSSMGGELAPSTVLQLTGAEAESGSATADASASRAIVSRGPAMETGGSSTLSVELPSSSAVVDAGLWATIDETVEFNPPVVPSLGHVASDAPVRQMLGMLRSLVLANPTLTYKGVHAIAVQLTGALQVLGCPLEEWSRRVLLLLKYVNRRDFLEMRVPNELAAIKAQEGEYLLALEERRHGGEQSAKMSEDGRRELDSLRRLIEELEGRLTVAKSTLAEVEVAVEKSDEAGAMARAEASSIEAELERLEGQRGRLRDMVSFPCIGILPLEDLFRGID